MDTRIRFAGLLMFVAIAAGAFAQSVVLRVGDEFPGFSATDAISSEEFSLNDLRGKVVLIDFWATWCRPCLAELPNVRAAHEKYAKDGLEIVSISLDRTVETGVRYIEANDMPWRHVVEGGSWNTRLAKQYGIRSIPAMYLLDRDGKIAAVRPRGQRLQQALASVFGVVGQSGERARAEGGAPRDASKQATRRGQAAQTGDARKIGATSAPRMQHARKLLNDGQYAEAVETLESIIRLRGDSAAADVARKLLEKVLADETIAPALKKQKAQRERQQRARIAENLIRMGETLAAAEKYEAARRYYQRVIDEFSDTEFAKPAKQKLDALPK